MNNNLFNILRLIAALQVFYIHTIDHYNVPNFFGDFLYIFPGVPIFFFISGYFIYGSYDNKSKDNSNYLILFFFNRFIRLYPALLFCLIVTFLSGLYMIGSEFNIFEFIKYILLTSTFAHFYSPDIFNEIGVGVINGSLWSITVEIQFYILIPLLHWIMRSGKIINFFVLSFFVILNIADRNISYEFSNYINVSFIPWFYMFYTGALFYKYKSFVKENLPKNAPLFILPIVLIAFYTTSNYGWGNSINPIGFFCLALFIYSIGNLNLNNTIINYFNKNDFSYSIYIYHMPIINFCLYLDFSYFSLILLTLLFSIFSWFLIEKPIMRNKNLFKIWIQK